MSLPWDEFQPEPPPPEPEPELPYSPPPNLPQKQADFDFGAILKGAFTDALRESGPQLREQASDYFKDTLDATLRGEQIAHDRPTITAVTKQGQELVVADAKSRSWRTLLQGLGIDLVFGLTAVLATLTGADLMQKETWILLGALLIKTAIQTVVAYVMRLKVTPTMRTAGEKLAIMPMPRPMLKSEE